MEFDAFWYECVMLGAAYFFRWLDSPRSTVLVIWRDRELQHVEVRKAGDLEAAESERALVLSEVCRLFAEAGFGSRDVQH